MISVGRGAIYDGRNAGKMKEGKEKDKGHDIYETSEPRDMFAMSFRLFRKRVFTAVRSRRELGATSKCKKEVPEFGRAGPE